MNCCSVDWQNNMKTYGIHTDQSDSRFNLDEICFKHFQEQKILPNLTNKYIMNRNKNQTMFIDELRVM